MKRVALFPSAFHPSLGGVEELTGQLALQLTQQGHEVLVCTNRWPRTLAACESWNGVAVRRFAFRLPEDTLKARVSFHFSVARALDELVQQLRLFRADVVHIQCVSSNAWYAVQAAERLKLPLVLSSQGERTMDSSGIYGWSPLYNRVLRNALARANWVTACSKATLMDLERYWGRPFPNGKSVVYNGVGAEAFAETQPWGHPTPYLLALGRFVKQKGFAQLLEAFAQANLTSLDLLIAGEGPEQDYLSALRDKLGLNERVHFVGRAGRTQVRALIAGCAGMVVPSLREPMGIVALEGMAAGKPLVVSGVDGLLEVVPKGDGVLHVPPGNVASLATGLGWLSEEGRRRPFLNHRHWASGFLWEQIAQEYISLYERVTHTNRYETTAVLSGVGL